MANFDIVMMPDKRLSQVSIPVEKIDDAVRRLINDMFDSMHATGGVGLAAPQIGSSKSIFILDVSDRETESSRIVCINPKIVWKSEEEVMMPEGCLSLPGLWLNVNRPKEVEVEFLDETGCETSLKADGWLARGIQHEGDHLNGITMLNYFSPIKQRMLLEKSAKIQKRDQRAR